jgi:hypothetical protein
MIGPFCVKGVAVGACCVCLLALTTGPGMRAAERKVRAHRFRMRALRAQRNLCEPCARSEAEAVSLHAADRRPTIERPEANKHG